MLNITIIIGLMTNMGQPVQWKMSTDPIEPPIEGISCVTWDSLNGTCVDIDQCPSYYPPPELSEEDIRIHNRGDFFDNSNCSQNVHGKKRFVCCPPTTPEVIKPTPCVTPNKLNGTCIDIEQCPWIDSTTMINIRISGNDEYSCDNNPQHICCPPMETATSSTPQEMGKVDPTPCMTTSNISGTVLDIDQCASLYSSRLRVENAPEIADQNAVVNHFTVGFNTKTQKRIVCCPPIDVLPLAEAEINTLRALQASNTFPKLDRCGISNAKSVYTRIVGGFKVVKGQFPWMVMLGFDNISNPEFKCGGSLIANNYVLTAAHCIARESPVSVEIGKIGRYEKPEYIGQIVDQRYHDEYRSRTHDVAILKVKWLNQNLEPVDFKPSSTSNLICMPHPELESNIINSYVGYHPYVAGWGQMGSNAPVSDDLLATQVVVVANQICHNSYRRQSNRSVIDSGKLCANWDGHDACTGDSGGPLMLAQMHNGQLHYFQIGVVSYGLFCGLRRYPGVYMRISTHLPWIHKTVMEMEANPL